MKKLFVLSALLLSSTMAKADIVCNGDTGSGPASVVISSQSRKVTVSGGALENPQVFTNLSEKHGIITAPGLAVYFRNDYGCMRDATIITIFSHDVGDDPNDAGYVEVMHVDTCSGGSTPDRVCGLR